MERAGNIQRPAISSVRHLNPDECHLLTDKPPPQGSFLRFPGPVSGVPYIGSDARCATGEGCSQDALTPSIPIQAGYLRCPKLRPTIDGLEELRYDRTGTFTR